MISLSPPFHLIEMATDAGPVSIAVFADHQHRKVFYYLPPPPRLVTSDDHPGFVLLRWRYPAELAPDGARGGGFASFAVEAGLTAAQLSALTSDVARVTGIDGPTLLPVLFRAGTARLLIGHDEGEKRMVDLAGTTPCSPTAPHRAAFSLSLDPAGATLLKQATERGDLPAAVHLELQFDGLLPALRARATLHYDRLYQRLGLALSGQYQCVRAELGAELAKARQDDDIQIEMIAFTSDEDRAQKESMVMALVQARIELDFFRPAMPPAAGGAPNPLAGLLGGALGGGGEPQASSAMFVLKARVEVESELRSFTLDFDSRSAVTLTHVAAAALTSMIPPEARDIRDIDLDPSFFRSIEVSVHPPPDFASMPDLRAVSVQVRAADRTAGFLFTPDQLAAQSFQVALGAGAPRRYEWRASFVFDPEESAELGEVGTEWMASEEAHLVPVVRSFVRYRRVRLASAVDWSRIRLVEVEVRALEGDRVVKTAHYSLTAERDEVDFVLRRAAADPEVELRVRPSFLTTDGRRLDRPEQVIDGNLYVAWNPVQEVVHVTLVPIANWTEVSRVVVDLRWGSGASPATYMFSAAAASSVDIEIPVWAPEDRNVSWKQSVILANGTLTTTEWAPTDGSVIPVGGVAPTSAAVRVLLLNDRSDILAVRISLEVEGAPPVSLFLSAPFVPPPSQEVRVPLTATGLDYHYRVFLYTEAGEQAGAEGQDQRAVLVVKV